MNDFENDKLTRVDRELLKKKYSGEELERVLKKIDDDYPVQYAIGNVDFLGYEIDVDERVLIPRFETELLVDKLIEYMKKYSFGESHILDVCTGSGCIAIAIKKSRPMDKVIAIDKSEMALQCAKENSIKHGVDIEFILKDVLEENLFDNKLDVLISNPPYVRIDEKVSSNTRYEPQMALYPGEDEIIFYKKIIASSKAIMKNKSILAFEIGSSQGNEVVNLAKESYPRAKVNLEKDYAGRDRFVFIFNNCE